MQMQPIRFRAFAFVAGVVFLAFSGWAGADPPSRVGRLGYLSGAVSFSPAGENDWVEATVNWPLTAGDRLWADSRARAEMQVGGAMIRMNANTGVSVLNLDDRIVQLQLTQAKSRAAESCAPGTGDATTAATLRACSRRSTESRSAGTQCAAAATPIGAKGRAAWSEAQACRGQVE